MNTNYDDEATQYQGADNKIPQYEEISTIEQNNQNEAPKNEVEVNATKKIAWKHTAVGAGTGLLIGGLSTILMGMKAADPDLTDGKPAHNNHKDELSHPEWVDDDIQVASSVNDDMSFGEAFATARTEVGPGGCFEWHGNLYGTYTADEWEHMTQEERADWSNHFSWNHIDQSSSSVAHYATTTQPNQTTSHQSDTSDEDIEIISINHENGLNNVTHSATTQSNPNETYGDVVQVSETESEVEILGVIHDDETGANIGSLSVDGNEIILIDVDGNMDFDYMASDLNGNGQIDHNELFDIHSQGLTVNDLGGFSNPMGDIVTLNDAPDYSSDIYEC